METPVKNQSTTKPPWTFAKVAALGCSVALVGAYVAYRGGGEALMPSTKSGRVAPTEDERHAPDERVVMPSSKSGPVTPPTTRGTRAVMPGSKSFILTDGAADVAQQPATAPSRARD